MSIGAAFDWGARDGRGVGSLAVLQARVDVKGGGGEGGGCVRRTMVGVFRSGSIAIVNEPRRSARRMDRCPR